ncbi:MAG: alpha-beta hydrolase superfamily lysophospholipase [Saprospiraceae bacterium]
MKTIKTVFYLFFPFYFLSITVAYIFQKQLIFQGKSLPEDYKFSFSLPHEEINLIAKDGTKINAIYIKTSERPKGVVLYFHGNADNLQRWANYHTDFTKRGYDFFAIDYRGYGKTKGNPDKVNLYSDAELAYNFVRKRYSSEQIIIYGRSLGTGIATCLATQKNAQRLILETPYNTLRSVMATRFIPLWMPFALKYPLENVHSLPQVSIPVTIFHGTKDELIAYELAEKLRPVLSEIDTFITIPGGGHKNLTDFSEFQQGLDTFLGK